MGTYYQAFAEARINGEWKGIDFYVFANGKYKPVELIEGKSYVGQALDTGLYWTIPAKELSLELQRDHHWFVEEEEKAKEDGWKGGFVLCVSGEDIASMKLDKPEHCGFVDKTDILAFEKGDTEDICEWLNAKDYAALPNEARIGYEWYQWSERGGTQEVWRTVRRGLQERIEAYNWSRYEYDPDKMPPSITMQDTRVIIFMS